MKHVATMAQLQINGCHLADNRDARTAGWADKSELDDEEILLLRERCKILEQLVREMK